MNNSSGLNKLIFDNRYVKELPADSESENFCRQVSAASFSRVIPTKVSKPLLLAYSREMAVALDLSVSDCNSDYFAQVFAGNQLLSGMDPYAMCYGGHQFGNWAGQLGDGRVINLGEIINSENQRWVLQLKGSGLTPYSRNADGLAVLRSSVREFLCSEAMYHLGVPTTRALSLILTGEQVVRDMFYDGRPKAEQGAIVCRVSPSFNRFGSFQIYTARGELDLLRKFVDFTIRTDFPDLFEESTSLTKTDYLHWFEQVCQKTAEMIVHWQRVGFVHGVMNTDNMSILGLTIDYGPYGWLDNYDPDWTPNTTDAGERRYRYGQQPQIALWNLVQLAKAIHPLIEDTELIQQALTVYNQSFSQGWQKMMADKLGLDHFEAETDEQLCQDLLSLLAEVETDMSIFYRKLALLDVANVDDHYSFDQLLEIMENAYYRIEALNDDYKAGMVNWIKQYSIRVLKDNKTQADRIRQMNRVNPKYVLRNYLSQQAIDKADQGDFSLVNDLLEVMRRPYDEQADKEEFAKKRPEWARNKPGCSSLSCSS
ncbi:MAG: YdiU family protein [Methylococcales symbiont of Hymedesmia sp. n. MRB-2018]|nr:MAG: YdiU family protein [Methylococcales symbiont of Hymedesmia sp. n. MRB-2018]KAF3983226.1 MAG: YdiU family protein [Methylococcales symbiont of Hymedesmia sp. n. MRB-2018]